MVIFSIKDEKTGAFTAPFSVRHLADAIRSLSRVANEPDNNLCRYAADYSLWRIAGFDDETGEIVPQLSHELNLVSLKAMGNPAPLKEVSREGSAS